MAKSGEDKKPGVEDLVDLLARGQDLLEQAQQTLAHAERVHAEVSAKPPHPPPPPPAPRGSDLVMFPWPPPQQRDEPGDSGGEGCRA
jgi:hypothetical protein